VTEVFDSEQRTPATLLAGGWGILLRRRRGEGKLLLPSSGRGVEAGSAAGNDLADKF